MDVFTERDADRSTLEGKRIVVMGYGNQGRPQALNMRDSGLDVVVAVREGGDGWKSARDDGFSPVSIEDGAAQADVLLLLLPDEIHHEVFESYVRRRLKSGAAVCFAHGFSVTFGDVSSDRHDMILVAPKGQGRRLRELYLAGSGLPCLIAVERDVSGKALPIAVGIASALGCLRVGAYKTTFREETVSDLFGEQVVLCGGVPALIKAAFDVLVKNGVSPEVAYFECFHELKIIVDLFTRLGFSGMRRLISSTAAYGSLKFGEEVIDEGVRRSMEEVLEGIENGRFAGAFLEDAAKGGVELEKLKERERSLLIEAVGKEIRNRMERGKVNEG